MNNINITLTGFMGTGKSTVGRLLADELNYEFVDTDALIEQHEGRTIAAIFREEGESAFRHLEAVAAKELATRSGLVISTGGRLMLDPLNASTLGATGPVFCLTAEPQEIVARLADDAGRRPLLDVPNPIYRVRDLLQQRALEYGRFPQISSSGRTPQQLVEEIRLLLGNELVNVTYPHGRYHVVVGPGLLPSIRQLAQIQGPIAVITDSNVGPLYANQCGRVASIVTIPTGEQHKTLATVNKIYDELLASGIDRQGTILALGGGVVGDVAGFVAATYMRGLNFVQCPTTLLAMVDASIGAKTGVDLPQGKNLVGAFKQPLGVFADLGTLTTLPAAEFAAGMAEVIKAGLIADPTLFERLESGPRLQPPRDLAQASALAPIVTDAIQVKRDVVQEDPFEKGKRAVLNLGHTFAHAIEQVSAYVVRHGEAVAMGLVAAAHLSAMLGICFPDLQSRIEETLQKADLPSRIPAKLLATDLYQAMGSDKKKAGGKVRFVLLRDVGDVYLHGTVQQSAVLDTLRACGAA
ncbi:MAG: 3-dehydroquinate synthase [Chloroflexi bacterium]|jgi:3-dehydroquinate synthase|nr:3-dehydroquinate synthase [Chloroflexota bacterium]